MARSDHLAEELSVGDRRRPSEIEDRGGFLIELSQLRLNQEKVRKSSSSPFILLTSPFFSRLTA